MSELIAFLLGAGLGAATVYLFTHPDKWAELKGLFKKKDPPA